MFIPCSVATDRFRLIQDRAGVTIHTPRLLFVAERLVEYATGKLNVRGAAERRPRVAGPNPPPEGATTTNKFPGLHFGLVRMAEACERVPPDRQGAVAELQAYSAAGAAQLEFGASCQIW